MWYCLWRKWGLKMTLNEVLQLIVGSGGLLGIAYLVFKTGRIIERIDNMDKKIVTLGEKIDSVSQELKETRKDIHSIDIRLAVLEAENIFYNCIPEPNIRSEAAKNVWKKRKQKILQVQEAQS
jgi:hypothetical protein